MTEAIEQHRNERRTLHSPELYTNRELSWLDFNERVLELAEDENLPLLERAKFLAIYASNLDEFFMVRVAGLHDQVDAGIDARGPDGLSPSRDDRAHLERTRELGAEHSRALGGGAAPRARRARASGSSTAPTATRRSTRRSRQLFEEQIFPVLTPLAVGPGRPFPYISNLSLSIAVWLRDPETEQETFARVKVPKEVLPRFLSIGDGIFVPLEDVIAQHLDALFPGHGGAAPRLLPRHPRRRLHRLRRGRRPAAGRRGRAAPPALRRGRAARGRRPRWTRTCASACSSGSRSRSSR